MKILRMDRGLLSAPVGDSRRFGSLVELRDVDFPKASGIACNMLPFVMGEPDSIPEAFRRYAALIEACQLEPEQFGKIGYLSVQENAVTADRPSQRRPGIHTEKHPTRGWGGGWGRGEDRKGNYIDESLA